MHKFQAHSLWIYCPEAYAWCNGVIPQSWHFYTKLQYITKVDTANILLYYCLLKRRNKTFAEMLGVY